MALFFLRAESPEALRALADVDFQGQAVAVDSTASPLPLALVAALAEKDLPFVVGRNVNTSTVGLPTAQSSGKLSPLLFASIVLLAIEPRCR